MKAGGNALWMRDPKKILGAMKRWAEATGIHVSECFIRPFLLARMNAVEDGELATKFKKEPIRPVIFSHGWTGASYIYSGLARDLASHGYIVLLLNHLDGTCFYTEDENGVPVTFDQGSYFQKELRVR